MARDISPAAAAFHWEGLPAGEASGAPARLRPRPARAAARPPAGACAGGAGRRRGGREAGGAV